MSECRIRVLDEDVASQIAAGEVVERPASVVKELVENAVDADATRIMVEVTAGGRELIRVADNGQGMTPQEAVLSLQRHATSKITRAEDLLGVRTLGFRGEALPSIASVSRLTLTTRRRGELEGCRLEAEAGEIRTLEAAGTPEGSIVTVRDLFYNTPARLKFLKSVRAELSQVGDVLTRLALSRPGVGVSLIADGEEVLSAPASPDPQNTIAALFGPEVVRELLPLALARPGIAVEGYISSPRYTRPTRSGHHTFVNGRWVRSRALAHALDEACRAVLPPGRFAFAVLNIDVDPELLDVNVHPAKTEVRFLREWEAHRAVSEAVRAALTGSAPSGPILRQHTLRPEDLHGSWLPPPPPGAPAEPADPFAAPDPGAIPVPASQSGPRFVQGELSGMPPPVAAARFIAQLWNAYLLAEGPTGLLIVDQHLAHERILYERLLAPQEERVESRSLPAPLTLQLAHPEALRLDEMLPALRLIGYQLEPFGRDAFVLRAVPQCVAAGSEVETLRTVIADLEGRGGAGAGEHAPPLPAGPAAERAAAATACRAAIRKGARLAPDELRQLLTDLAGTANPHSCPHGCPISVELSYADLLRRFKRA